jgi:murein L,D-transpeptidase YcbB/YkuD
MAVSGGLAMPAAQPAAASSDPVARALRQSLTVSRDPDLAAFYRDRNFRPLWVVGGTALPAAHELLQALFAAADDNLEAKAYAPWDLARTLDAANGGTAVALARADLELSRATAAWARDLRRPKREAAMLFVDRDLPAPGAEPGAFLAALGEAPSLERGLADLRRMHPEYEALRAAALRARSDEDALTQRLLDANLDRARPLPADAKARHLLVDVAAQQLEMWEGGEPVDRMSVVVGKRSQPTPSIAGLVRFLVLRPYWHMPPDLAAAKAAPAVLREGPGALARQDLELVSDFNADAELLDPASPDWAAVAAGREKVYLRQRPGPQNMMGAVKFIFPNDLGVYLHDTPLTGLFNAVQRTESAGCVRVSNARRLATWLMGQDIDLDALGEPETIVNLPRPVPVYMPYLTARATPAGVEQRADIYRRDPPLLAALAGDLGNLRGGPSAAAEPAAS